jgi:hypothetical protein
VTYDTQYRCEDCGQQTPCTVCGKHYCADECGSCGGACSCDCFCRALWDGAYAD